MYNGVKKKDKQINIKDKLMKVKYMICGCLEATGSGEGNHSARKIVP